MAEAVPARPVGRLPHQRHRGRLLEDVEQVVRRRLGGGQQQVEVEVASDDGGQRQVGGRRPAEAHHAGVDDLAHPGRAGRRRRRRPVPPIARRSSRRRAPTSNRWRRTSSTKNGLPSVSRWMAWASATPSSSMAWPAMASMTDTTSAGSKPGQLDALHPAGPPQRAQRLHQGVGDGQLAVPVRAQHDQAHRPVGGDQVAQELQAALVGPLQVVQDEDDRPLLGDPGHEVDHGGEQLVALGVRVHGPGGGNAREPSGQGRQQGGQLGALVVHHGLAARRRARGGRSGRASRRTAGRGW